MLYGPIYVIILFWCSKLVAASLEAIKALQILPEQESGELLFELIPQGSERGRWWQTHACVRL